MKTDLCPMEMVDRESESSSTENFVETVVLKGSVCGQDVS